MGDSASELGGQSWSRPHLVEIAWPTLMAILVWRSVSKQDSVQRVLHKLGTRLAPALQWYSPFLASIFVVLVWTLFEIFWKYRSMDQDTISNNFVRIWIRNQTGSFNATDPAAVPGTFNATDPDSAVGFEHGVSPPNWLRRLNLVSQLACVPTFFIALDHARKVVKSGVTVARLSPETRDLIWKPSPLVNTILFVVSMPTCFSIMALRSSCRIWALITGVAEQSDQLSWDQVVNREMGKYRGDMELAGAFQFFTVVSFARLSSSYLRNSDFFRQAIDAVDSTQYAAVAAEYKQTIALPAFLGVYAFCMVGIVRCILNFLVAEAHVYEKAEFMAYDISLQLLSKVDTVFLTVMVLCVVNMFLICRMKDITDHLGHANLKFTGTRLLIIITQVQLNIISAFQVGSDLFNAAEDHKEMLSTSLKSVLHVNLNMKKWTFSEYSAHLLHTSLLSLECLVIVLLNRVIWGTDVLKMHVRSQPEFFGNERMELPVGGRLSSRGYSPLTTHSHAHHVLDPQLISPRGEWKGHSPRAEASARNLRVTM